MKKVTSLLALLCIVMTLAAQNYNMTVTLNDGTVVKYPTNNVKEVTFEAIVNAQKAWALPDLNFGEGISSIIPGIMLDKESNSITKEVAAGDRKITYTYHLNKKSEYQVASMTFANEADMLDFEAYLTTQGFNMVGTNSSNDYIYTNKGQQLIAFFAKPVQGLEGRRTAPVVVIGKENETLASWTRTARLEGVADMYVPFFGERATKDLMWHFELRQNHQLLSSAEQMDKGIYEFAVSNSRWNKVKYWFDVKTKSALEEVAIYCDVDNRPTPQEVSEFLVGLGFEQTGIKDGSSDVIYYNRELKAAAFVMMSVPSDQPDFKPSIQFGYMDLDTQVPPATVDLPWPVTEYNKITFAEAIEQFKKMPYYAGDTPSVLGEGFHQINTTSTHFPVILIMEGDNHMYGAALVGTANKLNIMSPGLPKLITDRGYEKYENPSVMYDTYVNWAEDKEVQLYTADIFELNLYFIAFEPNERKRN